MIEEGAAAGGLTQARSWTGTIDRAIGAVVEPIASLLIVSEVVILASGVFSRYVLHSALVWTDELATILFLWLAMLGAVVAYRLDGHMRLTAVMSAVPPRVREVFAVISPVIVAIFCLELLPASGSFLQPKNSIDLTPALSIPRSYVIAAIVVGLALILVLAILRLINSDPKIVLPVVACAVLISAGGLVRARHLRRLRKLQPRASSSFSWSARAWRSACRSRSRSASQRSAIWP